MACILVPAVEAAVVTVVANVIKKREKAPQKVSVSFDGVNIETVNKTPFSKKLKWLSLLQWGGCVLLAFEHIWHGEIVPWFPFLTAVGSKEEVASMVYEMATVGVAMSVITTAVWLVMLGVVAMIEKRAIKDIPAVSEGQ